MYTINMFAVFCGLVILGSLRVCHADNTPNPNKTTGPMPPPPPLPRREDYLSVLYVSGTHYECGYAMGRMYGLAIQEFVAAYSPLPGYLANFALPNGKKIYDEALKNSIAYFPQYVYELQGIADGSCVAFERLFLITLDDTLPYNVNNTTPPKGCTSIIVNQPEYKALGHTEDALIETVNNLIILCAHITPSDVESHGVFKAREEKFRAVTYLSQMPGFASGVNYYGVVFSINTLFVSKPLANKIPRLFITRALLSARADLDDIMTILLNEGVGTADAFNVNLLFLTDPPGKGVTYTIEVVPDAGNTSVLAVTTFQTGNNSLHTNRILHASYPEEHGDAYNSSLVREARYANLTNSHPIKNEVDLVKVLGNQDDITSYAIFSDSDSDKVNTILLGIFDLNVGYWMIWTNDPFRVPPLVRLPLNFTDLVWPAIDETVTPIPGVVLPAQLNGPTFAAKEN